MSNGGTLDSDRTRTQSLLLTCADFTLVGILELTRFLSRFVPPSLLDSLFDFFGAAAFYARPGARGKLVQKIRSIITDVSDQKELERIGRRVFAAFLRPILDLVLFSRYGDTIMRDLEVEGLEHLERADAQGKGVLMLFAHTGSFDISSAVWSKLGKPFTPVIFHPASTPVPHYVSTMAIFGQMLGCDRDNPVFWAGNDTVAKVRGHLSKGKRVAITFDVDGPCIVDFFGRPAALADGIARFALSTGAPIVPYVLLRGKKPLERRLIVYEPLRYELSGEKSKDIATIMEQVVKAGERMVREDPGQWMSLFGLWHWWEKAEELSST
jgi:Kdo2-lipid IVA lauroyltransferase/acyltransferase